MSSKTIQFGPFSPQELEKLIRELQLKNIPFELAKDEKAEKKFKAIDYSNLLSQTHWRTEHYMAQIFYVTLAKSDLPKVREKIEEFGFPTTLEENPKELVLDEQMDVRENVFLKAKIEKKNFNRRLVAWLLIVGFLCLTFIGYALQS
jgi:hypothetical protein